MDEERLKTVVEEAANDAVHQTLTSLGIDLNHPIDTQTQMAALRELSKLASDKEFQADLIHLRKWRLSMDTAQKIGFRTIITMLFTGLVTAIGLGLMQIFKGGGQ